MMVFCLMIRRPPRSTRTDTLSLHDALPISKHVTRMPRSPWRIERLGVRSACAGHRHMAVRPCQVPPRAPTRSMSSWDGRRAVSGMVSSYLHHPAPLPLRSEERRVGTELCQYV